MCIFFQPHLRYGTVEFSSSISIWYSISMSLEKDNSIIPHVEDKSKAPLQDVKSIMQSAAELMDKAQYNPIESMVRLRKELEAGEFRQYKLEFEIDKELMKYYRPSAQASANININEGGNANIAVLQPLEFRPNDENTA